ncbi:sensor histidine kinase [Pseudonocardia parietis]|uniref:Signal transduction histidine kinase n=1 Tax=Pseudonocardia parietis TaxID=570936 RepID=A0ABS4VNR6_9PSEU|nr:histidine kinase [Pseudonocardia parietis]MBP2365570.1 signal transduction histidine kinase [Pseudonocardia parietis]
MTVDPACRDGDAAPPPGGGPAAGWSQWSHRRGLERRLHDGAALRISALALRLGLVRCRLPDDDTELHEAVDGVQDELHAVLQELRGIAAALYPPLLDEAGLGPALREEAGRRGVRVTIDVPDDRFGPAAEGAAYFAVVSSFAGGPRAGRIAVTARRDGADLLVRVDGVGPAHTAHFREVGGTVTLGADGATITARFPCG